MLRVLRQYKSPAAPYPMWEELSNSRITGRYKEVKSHSGTEIFIEIKHWSRMFTIWISENDIKFEEIIEFNCMHEDDMYWRKTPGENE